MILFVSRIDNPFGVRAIIGSTSVKDLRLFFVLPSLHAKYHIKRLQQKVLLTLASVVRASELEL